VDALRAAHSGALAVWLVAGIGGQLASARGRRLGGARERLLRRRLSSVVIAEHLALVLLLLSGVALMWRRGWSVDHARWLGLKLGLVAFLVAPLEGMHAWVAHVWIARGLVDQAKGAALKDCSRGLGIEEMLRTLALPLLGAAIPLLIWLSVARPF
jgi:hypothetical protein